MVFRVTQYPYYLVKGRKERRKVRRKEGRKERRGDRKEGRIIAAIIYRTTICQVVCTFLVNPPNYSVR